MEVLLLGLHAYQTVTGIVETLCVGIHPGTCIENVLHVADDANDAEGHEEGKGGGCYQTRVLDHPEQGTGLHVEGEERRVGMVIEMA